MAGSLPRLPQRLIVRVETRRSWATSLTVKRSGRLLRLRAFFSSLGEAESVLSMSDIEVNREVSLSQWAIYGD